MVTCKRGNRCVHKSVVCKKLNPCGNNVDCFDVNLAAGSEQESGGGLGFGIVMIILIVVVVTLFLIIQVFLILRNEHKLCGYSKQREEGEVTGSFVSIVKYCNLPISYTPTCVWEWVTPYNQCSFAPTQIQILNVNPVTCFHFSKLCFLSGITIEKSANL